MSVSIHLTPIYGVNTDNPAQCYLLTIDSLNILLDCGWTDNFDPSFLTNLAKVAPSIHLVLLSHPDIPHLGALPYAIANLGLTNCTILSTLPVWRMGQMFMYDAYLSQDASKPFTAFNLDHVDTAFKSTNQSDNGPKYHLLKYQQVFPLDTLQHLPNSLAKHVIVTPHPAGHMLGATVWHIRKRTESILYAVNFNHSKEKCLNPTTLQSFDRPSHLIISAARSITHTRTRKPTDLVDTILRTFHRGGSVLIPVDTAGRLIELIVQLHKSWESNPQLASFPLIVMHRLSSTTFEFARSMIEWMSDEVVKNFDISRDNLFLFKYVKHIQSIKALDAIQTPVLVLASSNTMEIGFSREIFVKWCNNPNNCVVLADQPQPDTLYAKLYEQAMKKPKTEDEQVQPLKLKLHLKRKEQLQGEELENWREEERIRKEKELEEIQKQKEEEEELKKEQEEQDVEMTNSAEVHDEETKPVQETNIDVEMEPLLQVPPPQETPEQGAENQRKLLISHLQRLGVVPTEAPLLFPYGASTRPQWDDYGQIVDTKRFMIGEDPGEGAPTQPGETSTAGDIEDIQDPMEENIPTKYVEEDLELVVQCELVINDCSGLSDGDSIKHIIKQIEPRHVTLIAGNEQDTKHLEEYLRNTLFTTSRILSSATTGETNHDMQQQSSFIISPDQMQVIDITSHTTEYEFALDDSVVKNINWNDIKLSKLAFADIIITNEKDENGMQILKNRQDVSGYENNLVNTDERADISSTYEDDIIAESRGHPTVFVGTVMLKELKDKIGQAGLKAEFAEGALCIENSETGAVVLLKKIGAQHIVMEGSFSEEYLMVKDLLYNELVIPT